MPADRQPVGTGITVMLGHLVRDLGWHQDFLSAESVAFDQRFGPHCQTSPLLINEPQRSPELFAEDSILLAQLVNYCCC